MNIKYFTCANSCNGFVNFTESNLWGINRKFILSCSSQNAVSNFIRRVGEYFENKNYSVEYILNPSDKNSFSGCLVRMLDFFVADKRIRSESKGIVIDIGTDESFAHLENKIKNCYEEMYKAFGEAKEIHDKWEKVYIKNMDFQKLDTFKKETVKMMFGEKRKSKQPKSCERFFGGSTKNGYVNLINDLTKDMGRRYFIKGRPGTGKSTFMKEVAVAAAERGFDTEIYRCSFDPGSLDMVIVREADFCVFDSTSPHEMFPTSNRDFVLDFYRESGLEGVDEKYKKELDNISCEYKLRIGEGMEHLRLAGILEKELEDKAGKVVNYPATENMLKTLIAEIEKQ